jgi:hypothetical protein
LVDSFNALPREARLKTAGVASAPGADVATFDPKVLYADLKTDRDVQLSAAQAGADAVLNYNLLYMLAIVSFWKMKDRARIIGETGGRQLLLDLQSSVPTNRNVHFHLMGHSFGCIVVSSMLQGSPGDNRHIRPIDSLSLVQGALSHWSYCSNTYGTGIPGYFRSVVDRRSVAGPIITTQSEFDTAVKTLYPYAARFKGQRFMADRNMPQWPEYGGIGCYGIQGDKCDPQETQVLDVEQTYRFKPGMIYNIECSRVINKMYPVSGAHSDIFHPEVAHAVWEAARVQSPGPRPSPAPPLPPTPSPQPSPSRPGILRRLFRGR